MPAGAVLDDEGESRSIMTAPAFFSQAVVNIENDEAVPKADTLTEICRTLHVSADELLFGESNTEQFSKTMERIQLLDNDLQNRFFEMSSVFLTGLETIQADRNEK